MMGLNEALLGNIFFKKTPISQFELDLKAYLKCNAFMATEELSAVLSNGQTACAKFAIVCFCAASVRAVREDGRIASDIQEYVPIETEKAKRPTKCSLLPYITIGKYIKHSYTHTHTHKT